MAEFSEIMRQARRMCNEPKNDDDCAGCRLDGGLCARTPREWTDERIAEFERVVMNWAAKHPEPQYPTWGEWLAENNDGYLHLMDTLHEHIPADIAEKLGLKPKED